MFIFRFFWAIFSGIVRLCLIIFVGVCLLNTTSNAVDDFKSPQESVRAERMKQIAKEVAYEARYQLASALDEIQKYQVIVVKHER